MAGAYLREVDRRSVGADAVTPGPRPGANDLYRRECYEDIAPLPAIVGWDMIDANRARLRGWRTESVPIPSGDPLHLRPMGAQDGLLRSFRRWGMAAYALGEHPLHVFLHGVQRMGERPRVIGGLNYLVGWSLGTLGRLLGRTELRAFVRRQQLRRIGESATEAGTKRDEGKGCDRRAGGDLVEHLAKLRRLPIAEVVGIAISPRHWPAPCPSGSA